MEIAKLLSDSRMELFDDPKIETFLLQKPVVKNPIISASSDSNLVPSHHPVWFDIRVLYVRVSSCALEEAPAALTMHCSPENISTAIELNGVRIPFRGDTVLVLKRDRMDKESAEVTYVSTDNLRTTGALCFKVYDKKDALLWGSLQKIDYSTNAEAFEQHNQSKLETGHIQSSQLGWRMECTCVMGSSRVSFTRCRPNFAGVSQPPPSVEVTLAGRVSGSPVILTETVKLIARRKYLRHKTMDVIQEDKAVDFVDNLGVDETTQGSENLESAVRTTAGLDNLYTSYTSCGYFDGDESPLSWFNAGVRVGVGIGLGMCLGLGLGVRVLARAYQSTSRTFHTRTFQRKFL